MLKKTTLILIGITTILAGCATPAFDLRQGHPEALIELTLNHKIDPNEYLDSGPGWPFTEPLTPLCALLSSKKAAPAVAAILEQGAKVNQQCAPDNSGYHYSSLPELGMWFYPLDVVIEQIILRSRKHSADLPTFFNYADILLKKGAESKHLHGNILHAGHINAKTLPEFIAQVNKFSGDANLALDEYEKNIREAEAKAEAKRREDEQESKAMWASTIGGLATIASMSAQNYAANKGNSNIQNMPAPTKSHTNNLSLPPQNQPSITTNNKQTAAAQPAIPTYSGQPCGPDKRCTAGDGYTHWCSGPDNGRPLCESECTMTSGVSYHDTSLPNNVAYMPSGEKCQPGCTVPNRCGG